jgi:RNA polymerase sigma-70 factor (ECF subfamily)
MNLTKEEFIRLKNKDPILLERLYKEHKDKIYNFLIVKTNGNMEAVEEIFSETIYSIVKSIVKIKSDKNIWGWICQIASRRLYDYINKYKKNENNVEFINDISFSEDNTIEEVLKKEKLLMVNIAMDSLKPNFKKVLDLKYIKEKSQKEIAKILNKTESSIENMLYRARESLKKELLKLSKDFE